MNSLKKENEELISKIKKQIEEKNTKPNKKVIKAMRMELDNVLSEFHDVVLQLLKEMKSAS